MSTKHIADKFISDHLRKLEHEMDLFGSAMPEFQNRPPHHLVVTKVEEHDFGWIYFYNSREFVETGDFEDALGGNAPVIFDRHECKAYLTGTAQPIEYYVRQHRAGIRRLV